MTKPCQIFNTAKIEKFLKNAERAKTKFPPFTQNECIIVTNRKKVSLSYT